MNRTPRPGTPGFHHLVQIFDSVGSLGRSVAAFLDAGYVGGEALLIIVRSQHRRAISRELKRHGHTTLARAVTEGRATILDAPATLAACMRRGIPRADLFEMAIGRPVQRIIATNRIGLRIYAEVVEVLAEEGNLDGAECLEAFWNQLCDRQPFTLLCGYSAAHFHEAAARSSFRSICRTHTQILVDPRDQLARWVLNGPDCYVESARNTARRGSTRSAKG